MSRQQFLAELTQYLTFVTPDEREQIIAVFEEKFDSVGPEGETALLMELGTPMSIAIAFKRRKEAGEFSLSDIPEQDGASQSDGFEQLDLLSEEPAATEPETEASAEIAVDEAQAEPAEIDFTHDEIPGMTSGGTPPQITLGEAPPRKVLSAGAAFAAVLSSIVLTALLLVPMLAGGYLIVIMANFVFAALQTLSTLTDALWMLCLGLGAGAVGLLLLWFPLWLLITTIRRMFRGKPAEQSVWRRGMKKTWKTVWIIFTSLLILGVACGAVGFSMGGRPNDLFDNATASVVIDWITDNAFLNLLGIGG